MATSIENGEYKNLNVFVVGGNSLGDLRVFTSMLSEWTHNILIDNEEYNLKLYEYRGDNGMLKRMPHISRVDAVMAVFAVDNPESLKELIDTMIPSIRTTLASVFRRPLVPLILAGIKGFLGSGANTRAFLNRWIVNNLSDLFPLSLG